MRKDSPYSNKSTLNKTKVPNKMIFHVFSNEYAKPQAYSTNKFSHKL